MDSVGLRLPTGVVNKDTLETVRDQYNRALKIAKVASPLLYGSLGEVAITEDIGNKCYRLIDGKNNFFITDAMGAYPYMIAEGDVPDEVGANTPAPPSTSKNKFIDVRNLDLDKTSMVLLTKSSLSASCDLIKEDGVDCTLAKASINGIDFWVIMKSGGTSAAYYCNSAGLPYAAQVETENSVTNVDFDYIVNNPDNSVDNSVTIQDTQIIDIKDNTFTLIDDNGQKVTLNIDSLLYDASNKNYTLNAYTTNQVFEGDTYYYTYNYYTYSVTYNITNTYITYIGSNSAYEKEEYRFYYELPDGRSSADLTADEVAGMSFQFHDVVNYAKSATDVSVRALYHFDGDTADSSYFSTQGRFDWTQGASITYMDSGVFEGALYLDNNAHAFDITLPSTLGSGDFTLQFRHYQASEPDTQNNIENALSIGAVPLLKWDEQKLYTGSGTYIAALPVGTWSEISLVRHSGKLYIYLNGLCVSASSNTSTFSDIVTFQFGSTSRAYTMLDELRVVNFAVAEDAKSYTPSTVPFDSNLVLVLPDSAQPLADEYLEISFTGNNLLGYDHTSFISGSIPSNLKTVTMPTALGTSGGFTLFPNFYVANGYSSLTAYDSFIRLTRLSALDHTYNSSYGAQYHYCAGLTTCLSTSGGIKGNTDYVFSVVLSDGSVCSLPFRTCANPGADVSSALPSYSKSFSWGTLKVGPFSDYEKNEDSYSFYGLSIVPASTVGSFVDIVYMELIEGTSTDLSAEWVSCVYPSEDIQPNTAAVQSDIPVNGYTVGGVRPTLPSRGDVWFPVSGSRITGCYIYTGTMWQEVGCRYYTGSRWIPIYAFDLVTLEDCYDIADAADVIVPITSESAFWRWWQLQWLDFRKWLEGVFGGSGPGSSSSDLWDKLVEGVISGLVALIEGLFEIITVILTSVLSLVSELLSFIFGFLTDTVLSSISSFFSAFSDGSLFELFRQENDDGTVTTTLPEGVSTVFAFFSGLILLLPAELRGVLFFGIAVLVLFSIFKLIRS